MKNQAVTKPKQNRNAESQRREAEDDLLRLAVELKTKTELWLQSRQKAVELHRQAESLKKRLEAAKERAKRLRATAEEIRWRERSHG